MQFSIVRYSEVTNKSLRFDGEYWVTNTDNYYVEFKTLSDLNIGVVSGPFGSSLKSESYLSKGVPFVRISNLENFFVSSNNLIYISEENHNRLSSSRLKINDLILSKVGNTIGVVSILTSDIGHECNISENNIGIRLWNADLKVNPYFLLVYLNCKIGQKQILRLVSGNAQPKLNVSDIKNLKIPILKDSFQHLIEKLISYSYKILNSSKYLYQQAEDILLEELGVSDWRPKRQLCYIKNFSNIQHAERFDAEYFQPMYDEIINHIKERNFLKLGDIVNYSKGFEVGAEEYIDEGIDFVRVSDFSINGFEAAEKKISSNLYNKLKNLYSPKPGDILFTKDGTIGISTLITENKDAILSGAFLKLTTKTEIDKEYLTLVLNSIICKQQIDMMSGGALIAHLKPSDAMNLSIPIIDTDLQIEIGKYVSESKKKLNIEISIE